MPRFSRRCLASELIISTFLLMPLCIPTQTWKQEHESWQYLMRLFCCQWKSSSYINANTDTSLTREINWHSIEAIWKLKMKTSKCPINGHCLITQFFFLNWENCIEKPHLHLFIQTTSSPRKSKLTASFGERLPKPENVINNY